MTQVKWDIRNKGRAWGADEALPKYFMSAQD